LVTLGLKGLLLLRFGAAPGQLDEWGGSVLPLPAFPVPWQPHKVTGAVLLAVFCLLYGALTWLARIPQARSLAARLPVVRSPR
jgi:hypothetical protein